MIALQNGLHQRGWLGHMIIYFLLFTEGNPKQLTLVFIGALHTFHIVTNMYVQFKHNAIQSNVREHEAY